MAPFQIECNERICQYVEYDELTENNIFQSNNKNNYVFTVEAFIGITPEKAKSEKRIAVFVTDEIEQTPDCSLEYHSFSAK